MLLTVSYKEILIGIPINVFNFALGISETEVTTVITSHDLLPKFKTLLAHCPNVNTIIYMEDQLHKTETTGFKEGVKILPFNQVVKIGNESKFGK